MFHKRFKGPWPAVNSGFARIKICRARVDNLRGASVKFAFPTSPAHRVNKSIVRTQIIAQLRAALDLQTRAALLARDEAISEESRPENQYDMHSQEAAYLAEGQARHAAETSAALTAFESLPAADFPADSRVALGALVEVAGGRAASAWYFLGPSAGGFEVESAGRTVLVLTPQSPLGRELLGKRIGEPVRLPRPGSVPHRIVSVR